MSCTNRWRAAGTKLHCQSTQVTSAHPYGALIPRRGPRRSAVMLLVRALGSENEARRVVGGVRWWQARCGVGHGQKGLGDEATLLLRQRRRRRPASTDDPEANVHRSETDETRCLLGLLFWEREPGKPRSTDFHLNTPSPALQDLRASYLFLIEPPPEAAHRHIKPSHIVGSGDSAGGGLALAFLQAVRDSGLPPPAGGVLVSPWCDLHRSFPSIFLNTDTDIVPATSLAIYKPSPLWPPPPDDLLRSPAGNQPDAVVVPPDNEDRNRVVEIPVIRPDDRETVVRFTKEDGTPVEIRSQIQLYTTNNLLMHPLVSLAPAYLGGLPLLFFIASGQEVLRDEIGRAANPEKYPVSDTVTKLYPAYEGIESRIDNDAAHVISMMFIATNPAKYCYRAIATFIKHVTDMPPTSALQKHKPPPLLLQTSDLTPGETVLSPAALSPVAEDDPPTSAPPSATTRPTRFSRMTSFRQGSSLFSRPSKRTSVGHEDEHTDLLAGDPVIYHGGWTKAEPPEHDISTTMVRERITTHGVIRPFEPEPELPTLHIDSVHLSIISARCAQVYLAKSSGGGEVEGKGEWWSVVWALDDVDERPPPSGLVVRCNTAEALALALAAAATKRKRNAQLAAAASVSRTGKRMA
ncbi:alpha/beta-hydrolase [Lactarius tabidus]